MFQCKQTENLASFIITLYGAASKLCIWFIKQSVMFRCKQTKNLRGQITLRKVLYGWVAARREVE